MKRDIKCWCRECHDCSASKVDRHTKAPLGSFEPPDRRFGDIHVDLVGILPSSEDQRYLFTIVDRYSRWPEAIPIPNAKTLLRSWFSRFGVPDSITSDRGPQFVSNLWRELDNLLGVKTERTTSYHPQANGILFSASELSGWLRGRWLVP